MHQDLLTMVDNSETSAWPGQRERRQHGRFCTRVPVSTRRDDLLKRGQAEHRAQCRLQMQDFSLGGLRADSPVPLKVNERLTLRLPASSTHRPLELTGRVVHCRRRQERYVIGIEFCQTHKDVAASPFYQLPRLFSVAFDYSVEPPKPTDERESEQL
jgi:hypothetical protein